MINCIGEGMRAMGQKKSLFHLVMGYISQYGQHSLYGAAGAALLMVGTVGAANLPLTSPDQLYSGQMPSGNYSSNTWKWFGPENDSSGQNHEIVVGDGKNKLDLNSGSVTADVYGGYGESEVEGNSLVVKENAAVSNGYGGYSKNQSVSNNTVTIEAGGNAYMVYGGYIKTDSDAFAKNNKVIIRGKVDYPVYGAYSAASGEISGNQVEIASSGLINGNLSGVAVYGAFKTTNPNVTTISGNSVTIEGIVKGDAVGAMSNDSDYLTDNSVTVSGNGQVEGNVYGAQSADGKNLERISANAVQLKDQAVVTGTVFGADAYGQDGVHFDAYDPKTANVISAEGTVKVGGLKGFNDLQMTVSEVNRETAVITSDSSLDLSGSRLYIKGNGINGSENTAYHLFAFANKGSQIALGNTDIELAGTFTRSKWKVKDSILLEDGMVLQNGSYLSQPDGSHPISNPNGEQPSIPDPEPEPKELSITQASDLLEGGESGRNPIGQSVNAGKWFGPREDTASGHTVKVGDGLQDLAISNGKDRADIFGGYDSADQTEVKNNSVSLQKGASVEAVYGGYFKGETVDAKGTISENHVMLQEGSLAGKVYGGNADYQGKSEVKNNSVDIYGSVDTLGGRVSPEIIGGIADEGDASSNSVVIHKGAAVSLESAGQIYGGSVRTQGSSYNNVVDIQGVVSSDRSDEAIVGGAAGLSDYGSYEVKGNKVSISGQVKGSGAVVGGIGHQGQSVAKTQISQNTVSLSGNASVDGIVYGGAIWQGDDFTLQEVREDHYDAASANIIQAEGAVHVGGLKGFNDLQLTVGNENQNTAVVTSGSNVDLTNSRLQVNGKAGLQSDKTYKLLHIDHVDGKVIMKNTKIDLTGSFINRQWTMVDKEYMQGLSIYNNQLIGENEQPVPGPEVTPTENSKTLAESHLGSIALVNQGGEFMADTGMREAVQAARRSSNEWSWFGAIHGGTSRYDTGSYVDLNSTSAVFGAAKQNGKTTYVYFGEAGWGTSVSHVDHTRSDGRHSYYGAGIGLKKELAGGNYLDGILRAGYMKTKFSGVYDGDQAHYDASSGYAGAYLGGGHQFKINDSSSIDVYGRYFVTYTGSDEVELHDAAGSRLRLDSNVAHGIRTGFRWTKNLNEFKRFYAGLAYEHIFNGDAESSVDHVDLAVPTLKGNTGILELGYTLSPSAKSPYTFDFAIKGYTGSREGISGNASVSYSF